MFDELSLEGLLIGHARNSIDSNFRPDALLLTAECFLIIEFKKCDDEVVRIPSEGEFRTGSWQAKSASKIGPVRVIQGGNQSNPFDQVSKQKTRLDALAKKSIGREIVTRGMVLFDGDATLANQIPGVFSGWFSIANKYDYVNVIHDAINTHAKAPLSQGQLRQFLEIFEVSEYKSLYPVDFDLAKSIATAGEERALIQSDVSRLMEKVQRLETALKTSAAVNDSEKAKLTQQLQETQRQLADARAQKRRADGDLSQLLRNSEVRIIQETKKSRDRKLLIVIGSLIVSSIAIFGFLGVVQSFVQTSADEAQRKKDLDEAIACIDYVDAHEYIGTGRKCVELHVGFVFEKNGYIWISDAKNGEFTVWVPDSSILDVKTAKSYLDKTIEVRGEIEEFESRPEIKLYDPAQISLVD